ncbi:hypothetical protein GOV13_00335 [Candidatus Pacearchaeota archaeon]|nr:hypothetical protein [Candidatus Pacearchaeota archaeon]
MELDNSIYPERTTPEKARKIDYKIFRGIEVNYKQLRNGNKPSLRGLEKLYNQINHYKARMAIQPWNEENRERNKTIGEIEEKLNKIAKKYSVLDPHDPSLERFIHRGKKLPVFPEV